LFAIADLLGQRAQATARKRHPVRVNRVERLL
jgi:hypothetical protein